MFENSDFSNISWIYVKESGFFNIFILAKFRGFRTCHRNSFAKADRSRFLQALDEALVRLG
jgi:hypothetical protein